MKTLSKWIPILPALLLSLLCLSGAAKAQEFKNVGHSGANFLQIPVEPVGAALGNAFIARAEGVEGLYWNPAVISYTKGTEVLLASGDWVLDTRISHLGLAHNFGRWGAFGVSLSAFTMDDMEITTEFAPNGTGEFFDAGNYAAGLSYALALTDRFSFGVTAKFVYEFIWDANASTVAFDAASIYRTDFHNLRIGMIISNFGPKMSMSGDPIDDKLDREAGLNEPNNPRVQRLSEEYSLPQFFNVGIAFDAYNSEEHRITVTSMANDPNDNDTRMSFGGEYAFQEFLMLRGGYKVGYDEQNLSAGLGIKLNLSGVTSRFDYGFTELGVLGSTHFLSLRVGF